MILLPENNYAMVQQSLRSVPINTFFARAVAEGKMAGRIYVNDLQQPETFYIAHSYGMSLLFGRHDNADFNSAFRDYVFKLKAAQDRVEWMQAWPGDWDNVLPDLFGERMIRSKDNAQQDVSKVELNTRVNFKFNAEKFRANNVVAMEEAYTVARTDRRLFERMKGSVVPVYFWKSAEDFYTSGAGYSVLCNGEPAAAAFAAFIFDRCLEIGIETVPEFRGKGLAFHACAALIDHCLREGYEPVWACRLENTASYKLAQKLGFEVTQLIPYYKLGK